MIENNIIKTKDFFNAKNEEKLYGSNVNIYGINGREKTLFIESIFKHNADKGVSSIVVDTTGKHRDTARIMRGFYVPMSNTKFDINPFELEVSYSFHDGVFKEHSFIDISEKVSDIVNIIKMLCNIDDNQIEVIAETIGSLYKSIGITEDVNSLYTIGKDGKRIKKTMPTFSHMLSALEKTNVGYLTLSNMQELRIGKKYGMFDYQTPDKLRHLDFYNAKFITFDLSSLKKDIERPTAMYILLRYLSKKRSRINVNQPCRIFCDEITDISSHDTYSAIHLKLLEEIRNHGGTKDTLVFISESIQNKLAYDDRSFNLFLKLYQRDIDNLQNNIYILNILSTEPIPNFINPYESDEVNTGEFNGNPYPEAEKEDKSL